MRRTLVAVDRYTREGDWGGGKGGERGREEGGGGREREREKERRGRKRGVDPAGWKFCFLLAKIEVICRLSLWNPV